MVLFNPTFFQQYGYREPRSHDGFDTPLAAYFKKPGYGFFDYLRDHPSVQKLFISAMHAQAHTQSILCSVYDYEARLPPVGDDPSAVAIVDVGGSQGELLLDLRARYPQMKGRMIVLDQKSTLQSLLQEPPVGIELVVHDIFTELPVKGDIIPQPSAASSSSVQLVIDKATWAVIRSRSVSFKTNTPRLERPQCSHYPQTCGFCHGPRTVQSPDHGFG